MQVIVSYNFLDESSVQKNNFAAIIVKEKEIIERLDNI